MAQYRKKPVVIEAMLFDGTNVFDCLAFIGEGSQSLGPDDLTITTLEGTMKADVGDWIVRGVKGEHYPCKPEIFAATYESVEEPVHG